MVARNPTKHLTPFPPVPRRVTIHAVFDGPGAVKAGSVQPFELPVIASQKSLHTVVMRLVRRVANWFAS